MDGGPRARLAAAQLLRWLGEQDGLNPEAGAAATEVDRLGELLGLQVALFHPASRREGTYGWLEPGENLIFLRKDLAEPVRRFTLAHEIGHAVLHRAGGLEKLPGLSAAWSSQDLLQDLLMPETGGGCEDTDLDSPLTALAAGEEILRPGEAYSARAQRESEANIFAADLLLPRERLLSRYLARAGQQTAFGGSRRGAITRGLAREFGVSEDVVLRSLAALLQTGTVFGDGLTAGRSKEIGVPTFPVLLDASQQRAATTGTPALIIAGPGTGKTSTLVGRVAYLVEECGIPADAVLALTFSNKAAREMRGRLAILFQPEANANSLLAPTAMPTVSTLHAFCADLIRHYAPLVGLRPDFRLISETEGYFLLRQVAGELVLHHYQPLAAPGLHFPALLAAISRAKDELAGPERYAGIAESMAARAQTADERIAAERAIEAAMVYTGYQRMLLARGDADFGDLIRLTVQLLTERPEVLSQVRSRYQHILVDEFQDINRAMGALLHILSGGATSLWAVGDADQAIYRFRGASPANLAQFTTDYPEARVEALSRNYRSAPDILVAAAAVAAAALGGKRTPLEAARAGYDKGPGATITLATAPSEAAELAGLTQQILLRTESGRSFGEQVILCRTRRQCQRVASALAAANIPSRTATPLLEQDDVKDILAVLGLLGDLSGSGLLRAGNISDHAFSQPEARAVLGVARATHQVPLAVLLQHLDMVDSLTPSGRKGLRTLAQILAELRQAPDAFMAIARYIFSYTHIGQHLLNWVLPEGQYQMQSLSGSVAGPESASLAQLLVLARAFEDQQQSQRARSAAASPISPQSRYADWAAFLDYIRVLLVLRQENAGFPDGPGTDANSVRILTVHASKGLEFPVVYLPGLADRRFPMQQRGNSVPLLPGLGEDEALTARDPSAHLAEEACLFYVALTRARDEIVLSRAEYYGRMRYKASPFLSPIKDALGERLLVEQWLYSAPLADTGALARASSIRETKATVFTSVPPAGIARVVGPVRHSEVEMYQRCPRQYAYRYVYQLQPREIGLATLRHALHAALYRLQQRFARPSRRAAGGKPVQVGLHEALTLFEREWAKRLEQERCMQNGKDEGVEVGQPGMPSSISGDAFLELYRRHGRQVIERAWTDMAARQSPLPGQETGRPGFDAEETRFDEQVTVQVKGRELSVVLDRVERGAASSMPAVPLRLVRHRLGNNGPGKLDLHALFYALAAQESGAAAPQLYSHNLTTGEVDRVILDERKLAKLREELDEVLAGIESGFYPPRPDPNTCQSCPFLLICPA
ncbi:MAG: UvrD-helicase domain-containing protein [Ktedonobacterales bacterium]